MTKRRAAPGTPIVRPAADPRIASLAKELGIKPKKAHALITAYAGGYKGADLSRDALTGWSIARGSPDELIGRDLPQLRRAHADLTRNHPFAAGAMHTKVQGVVGTGLAYHAAIDRDILHLDDDTADAWESRAESLFGAWAASKDSDVRRTLSFYEQQDLAFREVLGGDHFIQLTQVEGRELPFRLALQHIAGARVCNPHNQMDTPTLVQGVEKAADGAPLTYHVLDTYPDARMRLGTSWTPLPAFSTQTHRRVTLHLYRTLGNDQTRGIPDLAPVIEPLKQLDRYADAELDAAVKNAIWAILVESPTGTGLAGLNIDQWADTRREFYRDSPIHMKTGTSHVVGLFPDDKITSFDPQRPNAAFDGFVQSFFKLLGSGLEIPVEVILGHFSGSYSAARAALLQAWAFYIGRRTWLAANLCDPVLGAFMDEMVAFGRLRAPGYFADPLIRVAYLGAQWVGDAAGQIDETKAVGAAADRIALGISTHKDECTALTGKDYDQVRRQLDKETRQGAPMPGKNAPPQSVVVDPSSAEALDRADREEIAANVR